MKLILFAMAVAIFSSACAHHKDVRPGAEGVHRVVVRDQEKEAAERNAISQANHYCKEFGKQAAFVDEAQTQYTGSMDEKTRSTVKKASTAAMVVGGGTHAAGAHTAGGVIGTAGVVGAVMTSGDDYLADMKFKCQ